MYNSQVHYPESNYPGDEISMSSIRDEELQDRLADITRGRSSGVKQDQPMSDQHANNSRSQESYSFVSVESADKNGVGLFPSNKMNMGRKLDPVNDKYGRETRTPNQYTRNHQQNLLPILKKKSQQDVLMGQPGGYGLTRSYTRTKTQLEIDKDKDCFTTPEDLTDNKNIIYVSRRMKKFNDDDSGDDEAAQEKYDASIRYRDTKGNEIVMKPNPQLKQYHNLFTNLMLTQSIQTQYPIISMMITYDSKMSITLTKQSDFQTWIKMYNLSTGEQCFEELIGGHPSQYIKANEVVQNAQGTRFAIVYSDDGKFRLRTFRIHQRTQNQIEEKEVQINEIIGLDNYNMCNDDFPNPYITCCFLTDSLIFVTFFHNYSKTHYHFIYNTISKKFIGDDEGYLVSMKIDCSAKNFPLKCFYNTEKNEIYSFYRQGQVFVIDADDLTKYRFEKMTDSDLGQMVLINGEALIVRSSSRMLFFKQVTNKELKKTNWRLYHSIQVRGSIYFIKGNDRVQITTNEHIYFYLIDMETYMPKFENCIFNSMECDQLMFGSELQYGITYKCNQRSFQIIHRKSHHAFKMNVIDDNLEGSKGLELIKMNTFLVTKVNQVIMFDTDTFQVCGDIPIKLLESNTRERNEILGIQKSKDENWLAIITGKNLVMNEQKINQLIILKRCQSDDPLEYDQFKVSKRVLIRDFPEFSRVGMKYFFKNTKVDKNPDTIIFAKMESIFELNFITKKVENIHTFNPPLLSQPDYFVADPEQRRFVVASSDDGIWFDLKTHREVDLDRLFKIKMILDIIFDTETKEFYMLSNKRYGKLGFFLVKFNSNEPKKYKFMTMIQNNLDIGDVNLYILRGNDESGSFKELICSYKSIYVNQYNLDVFDLSGEEDKRATLLRHESFQLWESKVSGIILFKNKDFIKISKTGIDVIALGSQSHRSMKDSKGNNKTLHSLEYFSFLKLDPINYLSFKYQDDQDKDKVISIEQEMTVQSKDGHKYNTNQTVYSIRVHETTLRELMILQSFYITKTQTEIVNLVRLQPDQKFFYQTFLELDGSNMASLLAFNSRAVECLLSDKNEQYFSTEFPLIYKNKLKKRNGKGFFYHSALDIAVKNNQVRAVNIMIQYAIKYQNNYFSSFLFSKLIPLFLNKGIRIYDLLNSDIFTVTFDYDEWPGNHTNDSECIRAYQHSFFHLRHHYETVYPEEEFSVPQNDAEDMVESTTKIFKIKYSINLLLQVGFHMTYDSESGTYKNYNVGTSLMELCTDGDELDIFNAKVLQQLIEYKWQAYGRQHHLVGCCMHFIYLFIFTLYVNNACIEVSTRDSDIYYATLLGIGLIYPACYDLLQLYRGGFEEYVSDPYNFADFIYIWGSLANSILQCIYGPQVILLKVIMIALVVLLITKTFFFLRMFSFLTPIVVMITTVIYDLRIFLFFYFILILLLSQIFAVIGLGNANLRLDKTFRQKVLLNQKLALDYKDIGLHAGEFMWTLRMSMGDMSAVADAIHLGREENILFWICCIITVVVTCIIFLNFIVAEACASYSKVVETLDTVIWKEKTALISECEQMTFEVFKTPEKYPPYVIVREIES